MPNLSEVADDVPPREDGKALIGGPTSYGLQALLDTAFSGADGLPANDTMIGVQSGLARDHTYATMRTLLELYRCNLAVTPVSGQVIGVNASGILEAMEALLTQLSANRYTAGYGLRANGVAMIDEFLPKVWATSGAPASGTGYDGDYAIDFDALTLYKKGHVTPGTWASTSIGGGAGVTPQGIVARCSGNNLTNATLTPVEWDSGNAVFTDSSWTYTGTSGDHYWSPPAAGTYEVEMAVTVIKNTLGRSDYRMLGYYDTDGVSGFTTWPGAFENNGTTGDAADLNDSEDTCVIKTQLAFTSTSGRIRSQMVANSTSQAVKANTGYFVAKRIK